MDVYIVLMQIKSRHGVHSVFYKKEDAEKMVEMQKCLDIKEGMDGRFYSIVQSCVE